MQEIYSEDEVIRDLSRAREDAVNARVQAHQYLKRFLLRHNVRFTGKTSYAAPIAAGLRHKTAVQALHRRR